MGRSQPTVLVAEDEELVRRLARLVLDRLGLAVIEAADGPAALAAAAAHPGPIDLLLTDVYLRGFSGPELARRIEAVRPGLPVLYISGYPEEVLRRSGLPAGAALLAKPFRIEQLKERVRKLLPG